MRGGWIVRRVFSSKVGWVRMQFADILQRPVLAVPRRNASIFTAFSKESLAKERARLTDEINRGYFADIKELEKHGGKVFATSKDLDPPLAATKFPNLLVHSANQGTEFPLPTEGGNIRATLISVAFRANAQSLIDTWNLPFREAFQSAEGVQLYEISWIEPWLLSLGIIKKLFLLSIRSSGVNKRFGTEILYAFGDSYDTRKALNISNRCTGYIYLVDGKGRVRWRASGAASDEEKSLLLSSTEKLLSECSRNDDRKIR